jgi:hypothetical protein
MSAQHPLERRARMLAARIVGTKDALRNALAAEGERAPFTEHKTAAEAFAWWRAHLNDEYGARVLERMPPERIAELHLWLSRRIEAERAGEVV